MMRLPLWACAALLAASPAYNPLDTPGSSGKSLELTVEDSARARKIPLRVYLPAGEAPAPVVLFSHGLGGSRDGCAYLGLHWSARGYAAVFLQHPGSDDGVWRDKPPESRMAAMREAASARNFLLRVRDVPATIDQLERWNRSPGHPLKGRLDLAKLGMSGHSFGAVTTQAVSGQTAASVNFNEPRIKAAIAFSPSSRAADPKQAFSAVRIPWMLMTGTRDVGPIGDQTVESRLAVFPALPPGSKYELVLDEGDHMAFTERSRNPREHTAILALSTAFWDSYLKGDAAARAWLDGSGPRSVLDTKDRWQKK